MRAIYRANFVEDADVSDLRIVARCVEAVGESPERILPPSETTDAKAKLRTATESATRAGIFGAPTFVVRGELFWGNDRLEDALVWAGRC